MFVITLFNNILLLTLLCIYTALIILSIDDDPPVPGTFELSSSLISFSLGLAYSNFSYFFVYAVINSLYFF